MKILIIQPGLPDYRIGFFLHLFKAIGPFTLLHFDNRLKLQDCEGIEEILGSKFDIFNYHWANDLRRYCKPFDCIVAGHDIHWVNIFFLSFFSKKVVIYWSHGKSNSNIVNTIKRFQSRSVSAYLVYDSHGKDQLRTLGIQDQKVFIAHNTIAVNNSQNTTSLLKNCFIYVGRLQKRKGLDKLIIEFARLVEGSNELKLVLVGDGDEEKDRLLKIIDTLGVDKNIMMFKGTTDEEKLVEYLSSAYAYVSPNHVGLGVLHSFAYGVPVITIENHCHAPEVSNILHNENGYILGGINQLGEAMAQIMKGEYIRLGNNAFQHYSERRQISNMVTGFSNALNFVKTKSVISK